MAGRVKNNTNKIETDIEKNREESNWKRVIELAEQLKSRSKAYECLSNFLIGEGHLEHYLDENPPIEANITKAKAGLTDAKRYLLEAANETGVKAGVALDAHLLLGKLFFACGQYKDSLDSFRLAELHSLTEKALPIRSLRIVAESFTIKALCLEKEDATHTSGNRLKQAERDGEISKCFDLASDLTLLYLQELDKLMTTQLTASGSHSPQPATSVTSSTSSASKSINVIMEIALLRSPVLHLNHGRTANAVDKYRFMLSAQETNNTHDIRLTLSRQLAEVLLRAVSGDSYVVPTERPTQTYPLKKVNGTESPWKPKKYISINQFIPKNENEEILLLLLISEAMAVHNAVLSQSPEFYENRIRAYQNATAVYDLLALATVRWGQFELLQETFERAMKFSFKEPHTWHQQALCLVSMGRHIHALSVLKEVTNLQQNAVSPCLLAAKIYYEHLAQPLEGIKWSEMALDRENCYPQGLTGRCYIYIGIGCQLQAANVQLKQNKTNLNKKALDCFEKAIISDSYDHLAQYYYALQLAQMGHTSEAKEHVKKSLSLRPENLPALQLLVLLMSASQKYGEALQLVTASLNEYPDSMNLMYIKAHIELHECGAETALATAKKMLILWKNQYEQSGKNDSQDSDKRSETRSMFQLYTSEVSDKDSSSLQAHSIAASRIEQALSEAASSFSSYNPRPGPQRTWQLILQIWLLLAELYLALDLVDAVDECIKRAMDITPLSHHIMYIRGLVHMHKKEWNDAKLCFQNAVAVNPRHIKSLQRLGLVYHYLDSQRVAETTLRDAAKVDPNNHQTWYILGKVLESLGEYEAASNCMATALSVEINSPVLPYNTVPLCFE